MDEWVISEMVGNADDMRQAAAILDELNESHPAPAGADVDYTAGLDCLTALCRSINLLPLREMQATNERMQALGPILEPIAYQRGGGQNLDDQRRVIDAARALQVVCEDIAARGRDGGRR